MSNHIAVEGRLGADPELRVSQNNVTWMSLRVADSWKEDTIWWSVKVFGEAAQNFVGTQIVDPKTGQVRGPAKGDIVMVIGRVDDNTWTDDEGNERQAVAINAYNIGMGTRFMGTPPSGDSGPTEMRSSSAWAQASGNAPTTHADEEPF